jgi:hypothetical protein
MSQSNIVPFEQVSELTDAQRAKFGTADDLISGSAGFPSLSIRGSKWRVKTGGEEHPIVDSVTGDPIPSIELCIIKIGKGNAKNFYAKQYVEGDDSAPDCFSMNGEFPDPQATAPQCKSCAACPKNVWGSKISPNGNETKACSDSKLLAVSFASDLRNESLGGPMMLRVPAASLKDLDKYARALRNKTVTPQQVVTRVGFDVHASYPKLTFKAACAATPAQLILIDELFDTDAVSAITDTPEHVASAPAAPVVKTVDTEFDTNYVPQATPTIGGVIKSEEPIEQPKPKAKAKAKSKPKAKAKVESEPEVASPVAAAGNDDVGDAMADILGELDSLI